MRWLKSRRRAEQLLHSNGSHLCFGVVISAGFFQGHGLCRVGHFLLVSVFLGKAAQGAQRECALAVLSGGDLGDDRHLDRGVAFKAVFCQLVLPKSLFLLLTQVIRN